MILLCRQEQGLGKVISWERQIKYDKRSPSVAECGAMDGEGAFDAPFARLLCYACPRRAIFSY
jgi:hypothetical protein